MEDDMALKQHTDGGWQRRFNEFDEARIYIEDWENYSFEDVFVAIDYMLAHKEYYYLLKTIYNRRFVQGIEEIADYLFLRLDCLSRQADKEMIMSYVRSDSLILREKAFRYMLSCCQNFALDAIYGVVPLTSKHIKMLSEAGHCASVQELMKKLKEDYAQSYAYIEKFFTVYGDHDA